MGSASGRIQSGTDDDATAPARVLNDAIKEFKKMEFKGGFVEGDYYDIDAIAQIASIPS